MKAFLLSVGIHKNCGADSFLNLTQKIKAMIFVTSNKDKFLEARACLGESLVQKSLDIPEIQSENHYEVIKEKAMAARKLVRGTFFIEDMAFYIDALRGRPGTLVKFFVNPFGGGDEVYKLVHSYLPKNKGAFESTAIALFEKDAKAPLVFINSVRGWLCPPAGDRAFGFDRIFKAEGSRFTYAQLSIEDKNKISSRGKSLRELKSYLAGCEF